MAAKEKKESSRLSYSQKTAQIFRKILFCVLAVVCLTMIAAMILILNQYNTVKLENEVQTLSSEIDEVMSEKIESVETTLAAVESGTINGYEDQLALVDSIAATDSMISAVYIAYPDESVVYSGGWLPEEGFVLTNRPWYTGAAASTGVYLTEPYVDENTGQFCVTFSKALRSDNEIVCVVGMDLYLDNIMALVSDTFEGSSYSFLTSASGTILAHPDSSLTLSASQSQTLETALDGNYAALSQGSGQKKIISDYSGGPKIMMASDLSCGWRVISVNPLTSLLMPILLALALSLILFVIAVALSSQICKNAISKWFEPFETITQKMHVIAEGNLSVQFDEKPITTEIEMLTDTLNATISQLKAYIGDISHVVRNVAKGNLTVHKHVEYRGDFVEIEHALDNIVKTLNTTISRVIENAGHVTDCSTQMQTSTEQVAEGATSQNAAISELADNINLLSEKISLITESAEKANRISEQTNNQLTVGNEKMQEVVAAMENINHASDEIENIIDTINQLASQTNLLALNASIEAARAGQAGKGFAVVAEEIGSLAMASSQASSTIATLILESKSAVSKGKELVTGTAETISRGVENSIQLGSELHDITESVETQNEALEKISQGVVDISMVIETNAAASEENAAISLELIDRAKALQESVNGFTLK